MPHPPLTGVRRRALRLDTPATPKQTRRAQNRQAWQTWQALDRARRALVRAKRKLARVLAALRDAIREIEALQRGHADTRADRPSRR